MRGTVIAKKDTSTAAASVLITSELDFQSEKQQGLQQPERQWERQLLDWRSENSSFWSASSAITLELAFVLSELPSEFLPVDHSASVSS
jgi:hypothetical protein